MVKGKFIKDFKLVEMDITYLFITEIPNTHRFIFQRKETMLFCPLFVSKST